MVTETDLKLGDGRTLHAYDTGADDAAGRLAVFWHHGSPNIGAPPEPLFSAADRLGIRWVSYDRPGYGGSTPRPDRDVASAAADASAVADALNIDRFALMGHSSGGSHALAYAALLPERVLGVVVVAGMAPFDAEGLDWFDGFGPAGVAELRSGSRACSPGEALGGVRRRAGVYPRRRSRPRRRVVVVHRRGPSRPRRRHGRVHRRRSRQRGRVGLRPRRRRRSSPFRARMPGSGRARRARRVARAPLPVGRTAAVPGRRAHISSQLWRGSGHGLAPGARRRGLSPGWCSPECVEGEFSEVRPQK